MGIKSNIVGSTTTFVDTEGGCVVVLLGYRENTQMNIDFFMVKDNIATFFRELMGCAG